MNGAHIADFVERKVWAQELKGRALRLHGDDGAAGGHDPREWKRQRADICTDIQCHRARQHDLRKERRFTAAIFAMTIERTADEYVIDVIGHQTIARSLVGSSCKEVRTRSVDSCLALLLGRANDR